MPKTWVLVLYRTGVFPPTIIGGYATEQEAFDRGLSACELRLLTARELEGTAAEYDQKLRNDERLAAMWSIAASKNRKMIPKVEDPIALYREVRGLITSPWPFVSIRQRATGNYSWFDVIAGSAS